MQIQKNIGYDVKTLLQTLLDTMKSLRHTDNVAYPKHGKPSRIRTCFIQGRQMKSEKEIERGGYNVKI